MGANMNLKIQKILSKIESNGFEAYIVGGFVRDYLLDIYTTDVDICTNALPKDIMTIFDIKKAPAMYGSVSIPDGEYNFDITTYRTESNYEKRRPLTINYTSNLLEDIKRRDFTINALCMNKDGQIFDYLNGKKDIADRIIRVIGNTDEKLKEDPLRILRAIRFATTLNYKLDEKILEFIKNNKDLIKSLSYTRKKEELDKIFSSKNVSIGLKLLKELNLLDTLEINYDNIMIVPDLLGIWSQIDFSDNYPFTKNNLKVIKKIRNIVKKGVITNQLLFEEDLYIITVAAQILGIDVKDISLKKQRLPITSRKDLKISFNDIGNLLNIQKAETINIIYNDIINKVLDNKIINEEKSLKEYILKVWK